MTNNITPRVAELSATLPSLTEYEGAIEVNEEMYNEGEDSNSYNNASFYCDGWIKPCFENTYKGSIVQSVGEYQVIRQYYLDMQLEGLAYDEIPEDWDEDGAPDFPEPDILDYAEYRQVWIDRHGNVETMEIGEQPRGIGKDESYIVLIKSLQPWVYEPSVRTKMLDIVNEHDGYDGSAFTFHLSFAGEYLMKNEPLLYEALLTRCSSLQKKATRYFRTFKVAHRHHYTFPTDYATLSTYFDYLRMVGDENPHNLTNPMMVCPTDIQHAHDTIMERYDHIQEERAKREAQEKEAEFAEQHSWLFGISFISKHLSYKSLDSVEEYRREGEIMHHCIYKCCFYEDHDMLALHITDHEGNRVATCTINLHTRTIDQIQPIGNATGFKNEYGREWKDEPEYKEIWNTIMARMHTLPKRTIKQENEQDRKVA